MQHVPNSLAFHANGARFLQSHSSELNIYSTEEIVELACRNGLEVILVDGMFSMHSNLKEKLPIYAIHGICYGKKCLRELLVDTARDSA